MHAVTKNQIYVWLMRRLVDICGLPEDRIAVDERFSDLGLSAEDAAALSVELGRWLGVALQQDFLYKHPTVQSTVSFLMLLVEQAPGRASSPAASTPIADIGMGSRLPNASHPDEPRQIASTTAGAANKALPGNWDAALFDVDTPGFRTTHAHTIVTEARVRAMSGQSRPWQLLPLSAPVVSALESTAAGLADHLEAHPHLPIADVAFTLQQKRCEFPERIVVLARDAADAVEVMRSKTHRRLLRGSRTATLPVAFMFPGVGEQYVNMAAQLYAHEAVLRSAMNECFDWLLRHAGIDLKADMFAHTPDGGNQAAHARLFLRGASGVARQEQPLHRTALAQPAVFVVEYAMARLLMSWGVLPDALIGYSTGEFAAATIAGTISLHDALRLVSGRAAAIERLAPGAMLAVPLGAAEVRPLLGARLSLAVESGPRMCVVAGPFEWAEELESRLAGRDIICRRLPTSHAFHSSMMDAARPDLERILAGITLHVPRIAYVSNLTGTWITPALATDRKYWLRHMCETVQFGAGIAGLLAEGPRILLEVGPGQGLTSAVRQHPAYRASQGNTVVIPTMRTMYGNEADDEMLLGALGRMWISGSDVDWKAFTAGEVRQCLSLLTHSDQTMP